MPDISCCGNCRWWEKDDISDDPNDHICVNEESENLADWTEWNDSCEEWERRVGRNNY